MERSTANEAYAEGDLSGKYLTFQLADEEYGIAVHKVREIIGLHDITCVPQTEEYIKGVINLRGKVIPVIDLRIKFGLSQTEYRERTCIIVVETVTENGEEDVLGIIVDAVAEVIYLSGDQIEPTPALASDVATEYILGMAKKEGRVRILLDIDRVLNEP